jgi:alpha-tubulin suppressor-like RCC1 family protein
VRPAAVDRRTTGVKFGGDKKKKKGKKGKKGKKDEEDEEEDDAVVAVAVAVSKASSACVSKDGKVYGWGAGLHTEMDESDHPVAVAALKAEVSARVCVCSGGAYCVVCCREFPSVRRSVCVSVGVSVGVCLCKCG